MAGNYPAGGVAALSSFSALPTALNRYELNYPDSCGNLTTRIDVRRNGSDPIGGPAGDPKDRVVNNTFDAADQLTGQIKHRVAPDGCPTGADMTSYVARYDRAGNLTDDGRKFRYVYDARNQLVGVYRRQANGDVGAIFDKFIGLRSEPCGL